MAGIQYGNAYLPITAVTANPAEATAFPKTNMVNSEFPLLPCRSTVITQQDFVFALGSAVTGTVFIQILDTNYTSVQLASGTSATSTDASFNADNLAATIARWLYNGRYSLFVSKAITAKTHIRLRILAQTPVDNAAYFSTGAVHVLSAITTFTLLGGPFAPMPLRTRQKYYGTGSAVRPRTDFYIEMDWSAKWLNAADLPLWQAVALLGDHTTFSVFLNLGNSQESALFRTRGNADYAITGVLADAVLHLVEYIGPELT